MLNIFISYRRSDSQDFTQRLQEHMERFKNVKVFLDVENMPLGSDFALHLQSEIKECNVVLIMIGTQWSISLQDRVNQDDDFVRIEVETALALRSQRNLLVIPVSASIAGSSLWKSASARNSNRSRAISICSGMSDSTTQSFSVSLSGTCSPISTIFSSSDSM